MSSADNVNALKHAYAVWHEKKGLDTSAWLALMADRIRILSVGDIGPGMDFAKPRTSKGEAAAYMAAITRDWTMVHFTPETFLGDGDHCAMFGQTAWTNKATGKVAEVRMAHLWQFEGNKAVAFTELFDTARAMAAASP